MVMVQKRKKGKKNGLKTAPRIRAGKALERKDGVVVVVVRGLNKKKSIAASGTFPSLIAQRERQSRETEEERRGDGRKNRKLDCCPFRAFLSSCSTSPWETKMLLWREREKPQKASIGKPLIFL